MRVRALLFSKACALWTVPSGLCPAPLLNWNPDFSLISRIGPPLCDKTGSYFYLDKELQVMCLSSPWDETDWQRSAPLIMGFPAPIYFWISVSPTPPSSNNRLASWHDGEYTFFPPQSKQTPAQHGQTTNVAKEQLSGPFLECYFLLFIFIFSFSIGFIRATARLTGSSFWNLSFLDFWHFASFGLHRTR